MSRIISVTLFLWILCSQIRSEAQEVRAYHDSVHMTKGYFSHVKKELMLYSLTGDSLIQLNNDLNYAYTSLEASFKKVQLERDSIESADNIKQTACDTALARSARIASNFKKDNDALVLKSTQKEPIMKRVGRALTFLAIGCAAGIIIEAVEGKR